ncbi:MAG: phenylalanine--tRNA ligase subunit beta [Bacteroidetes bacterium]|jgi:phenylalanyl-tRNA synthetase beta chain|nr:phenylalanine--tRNA ligase subunit beta [Bacteroidota bacterium]
MKLSLKWLNDHIDLSAYSPEQVAEMLTDSGLEVEGIETQGTNLNPLDKVVVGRVCQVWPHPNADRLRLTLVDVGAGEPIQIVCGAPNVAQGQTVAVAMVGAKLPGKDGNTIELKKGKIRGELSMGMICAEDELGLGNGHEGIMVLADNLVPGSLFFGSLPRNEDWVFEIGLTPNRVDAASHRGAAVDLSAKTGLPLKERALMAWPQIEAGNCPAIDIQVPDDCHQYAACTIQNVTVGDSPEWLANRLLSIGIEPINNIVDAANYVMFDMGQPLHAFDLGEVAGRQVTVRKAVQGERLLTLDGKARELKGGEPLIADSTKALALAGVIGGKSSAIAHHTTSILLESAYFNPQSIRLSAKWHQISTDASFRFERGANAGAVVSALRQTAEMVLGVAGGNISGYRHVVACPSVTLEIALTSAFVRRVAGIDLPMDKVGEILSSLGFGLFRIDKETWQVAVPPSKPDVLRPIDLMEEVLRIYGYNKIPLQDKLHASLPTTQPDHALRLDAKLRKILNGEGLLEIKTNPFDDDNDADNLRIANPLSAQLGVLRASHIKSGLSSLAYNLNRQQRALRFFEIAKEYGNRNGKALEKKLLTIWLCGSEYAHDSWQVDNGKMGFYQAKALANKIMLGLGLEIGAAAAFDEPGKWAYGLGHEGDVVKYGQLDKKWIKLADIEEDVFCVQFEYDKLLAKYGELRVRYKEPGRFPWVTRDLSFVVADGLKYHQLFDAINQLATKFLTHTTCFDVYRGKSLGEGLVSYALRFVFENQEKTLTDLQVEHDMSLVIHALEGLGCQIRK